MTKKTIRFKVKGMYCGSCEKIIKKSASKIRGVSKIDIDYATEKGEVTFDDKKTNIKKIFNAIDSRGYDCNMMGADEKNSSLKIFGTIFGIIGILVIGYFIFRLSEGIALPEISAGMGYGLLFLVGILTGFHCVSMCGGFVISYTAKHAQEGTRSYSSHFMYGAGKTISYTIIGATFGLLGSIIAFTPTIRGVAGIVAGIFLVIFGLSMFGILPWLRKIRFKTPKFISRFVGEESKKHSSPLIIGLLNGLMIACGPLQAIYIMAAGTGSVLEGAKLLFVFGLGTLPVLLSFGFITTLISRKATQKILKASGAIVIILGLIMVNRGLALTGTGMDTNSLISSVSTDRNLANGDSADSLIEMENGYQIIRMDVDRSGWTPDKFILKKGVPVKWIINGKEINGCNNAIQVPKLSLEFDIKQGMQTIEFTPTEEGIIPWSCWMGMIRGTFIVKEDIDSSNSAEIAKELNKIPQQTQGTCGGSSGGCGCGGAR